jgi:hypothetical protein
MLTRREFLQTAGALTGSALLTPPFVWGEERPESNSLDEISRVVVVTDTACTTGSTIHQNIINTMMNEAIKSYTEILDVGQAWMSLFPGINSNSVIGIKVVCTNNQVPSNPETVQAIVNGLLQMPIPGGFNINKVIVWDRTNYELTWCGFTLNTGTTGMRCFGTNQSGVGYNNSVNLNVNGVTSHPSRIYTDYINYLINLPALKDHGVSGATLCLKNHLGSVNNPGSLHGNYCNPYLPSLNQQLMQVCGNKEKIRIIDSIFGINAGGPSGPPDFVYNGIILGEDIVAVDRIGLDILVQNGMNHAWQATHIQTASQPPYNLGNYDLSMIERVNIYNPSTYIPHNVTITLTPVNPPIVIPSTGGTFNFTVNIVNNDTSTVSFGAWLMVQLPTGTMFGPIQNRNLTLAPGATFTRNMSQYIPAGAPAGTYQFIGRAGVYPIYIWSESQFPFVKQG